MSVGLGREDIRGLLDVEQAYPGRPIPAKVKFLLTEIVDSMQR